MIPKSQRVKKAEFTRVFSLGRTHHGRLFTMRVLKRDGESKNCSFVVSKAVAPNASGRNPLRRRGYSAVRTLWPRIKSGHTLVFFFKKEGARAPYRDIAEEIKNLLSSARLIQ